MVSGPGQAALTEFELRVKAEAQVRELAERLESAEREREYQKAAADRHWDRAQDAERDLASSQAAALLLHKRVEELENDLAAVHSVRDAHSEAQLAERDKRIEGLRGVLTALHERVEMDESVGVCLSSRVESLNAGAVLAALADPVLVPGWDDGTWDQEGCG